MKEPKEDIKAKEEKDKACLLMFRWYNIPAVKFKIIKYLYNRELCFLVPNHLKEIVPMRYNIRYLRCHNVQGFDYLMSFSGYNKGDNLGVFNLYYSIAKYRTGLPYMILKAGEERTEQKKKWSKNHHHSIVGYDFFIDFDAPTKEDLPEIHEHVKKFKKFLDLHIIPYNIRFSGMGFHVIIPYEFFAPLGRHFNPHIKGNIYELYSKIARKLNSRFSKHIDTGIYDSRRVCKIPYSLVFYENDYYVTWEFSSDSEFEQFNPDHFKIENFSQDLLRQRNYPQIVFNSFAHSYPESFLDKLKLTKNGNKRQKIHSGRRLREIIGEDLVKQDREDL